MSGTASGPPAGRSLRTLVHASMSSLFSPGLSRRRRLAGALALVAAAVSCSRGGPAGPQAMPPSAVGVQQLVEKPVVITSEFVAVVRSRRSSEVRPQVEGVITEILVKSGDRVSAGRPLLQIDGSRQVAAVASDEASRAAQDEGVTYAQQQYERAKQLLAVGAISQQEYEQAQTAVKTATASQAALKAKLQESQVQLQLLSRHRADRRRGRRRPCACRRPRDDRDRAHHDRPERGP